MRSIFLVFIATVAFHTTAIPSDTNNGWLSSVRTFVTDQRFLWSAATCAATTFVGYQFAYKPTATQLAELQEQRDKDAFDPKKSGTEMFFGYLEKKSNTFDEAQEKMKIIKDYRTRLKPVQATCRENLKALADQQVLQLQQAEERARTKTEGQAQQTIETENALATLRRNVLSYQQEATSGDESE